MKSLSFKLKENWSIWLIVKFKSLNLFGADTVSIELVPGKPWTLLRPFSIDRRAVEVHIVGRVGKFSWLRLRQN